MNRTTVWHSIGGDVRVHSISDFEFAVFNGLSWDSSVVNAVDASLLECLAAATPNGLSEADLFDLTTRKLDLSLDAMFVKYSQEALAQMAEVGLICKEVTFEDQ